MLTAAIAAIDIALHDIAGRALGVPVYQLLGGRQRDFVPCFATTGAAMGPRLIEDTQLLISRGWNVIRTVPGHPRHDDPQLWEPRQSIGLTASWLTKLREAVGPDPVLGIDYHHRLSVAETASFCQRMPSGTLDFLEEPIRDETPEAYAAPDDGCALRHQGGILEQVGLPAYIESGLTQFAIDVCNVGV